MEEHPFNINKTMNLPNQEDSMHGSLFVFLKRFVESNFDFSTWIKLLDQAHVHRDAYLLHEMYPTSELEAIVQAASTLTGLSRYDLQLKFGEFLVPDLLLIYKKHIKPEWRTYELLENTELSMHSAVRQQDERSNPPVLLVTKMGNKQLIVDYYSKRKMAGVAIGIIKGIAAYYNESEKITITPVTKPEAERVQIRVQFN